MSSAESTSQVTMNFEGATAPVPARRTRRRGPTPHFKPDTSRQMNAIRGTPSLQVPKDHLAWKIQGAVEQLDTGPLEEPYSSLGRHGFHPKRVLAVWVYASAIGMHHASKVAMALKTDAAFLLLSGGHPISAETLRRFRRTFAAAGPALMHQVLVRAVEQKLVAADDLALDSVRLEADASMDQVRRVEHSAKRLVELGNVDLAKLDETQQARHQAQVKKHEDALATCRAQGRTSVVLTCASAGLLKFPYGASKPGHRVSAVVSGASSRFVVALLIDAASCDYGKVEPVMEAARKALIAAGVGEGTRLQVAADAGYFSANDLAWAAKSREHVDVLIKEPPPRRAQKEGHPGTLKHLGREDFKVDLEALTAICPAGTPMKGPYKDGEDTTFWRGDGCKTCPLKQDCTPGERRKLTVRPEYEKNLAEMRERMALPGARDRYNRRMATVEPAFGYIEDVMAFRRLSSRKTESVQGEIHLKVFVYNLLRLLSCARSFCVLLEVVEGPETVSVRLQAEPTAA
jgi:hypothetical protein